MQFVVPKAAFNNFMHLRKYSYYIKAKELLC